MDYRRSGEYRFNFRCLPAPCSNELRGDKSSKCFQVAETRLPDL
jgi:hypothetical protein